MKKLFLMFALTILSMSAYCQSTVGAYISDNNGKYSNVRNAPNGAIVDKIPVDSYGMMELASPKNGWWKIIGGNYDTGEGSVRLKTSKSGHWIHFSCIACGTRNYGNQKLSLRSAPSKQGRVTYTFSKEIELRPIDVKGSWVKVKTTDGKHEGWIESDWLCGNSLTNCC